MLEPKTFKLKCEANVPNRDEFLVVADEGAERVLLDVVVGAGEFKGRYGVIVRKAKSLDALIKALKKARKAVFPEEEARTPKEREGFVKAEFHSAVSDSTKVIQVLDSPAQLNLNIQSRDRGFDSIFLSLEDAKEFLKAIKTRIEVIEKGAR